MQCAFISVNEIYSLHGLLKHISISHLHEISSSPIVAMTDKRGFFNTKLRNLFEKPQSMETDRLPWEIIQSEENIATIIIVHPFLPVY